MRFRKQPCGLIGAFYGLALFALAAAPMAAVAAGAQLQVRSKEPVAQYIVDSKGMTLYLFKKDQQASGSTCYDACAAAWPPLTTNGAPAVGQKLDQGKLSTIQRRDGSQQVTYGGWPLYYYVKDQQPGDIKGHDVMGFGAEWYAVAPNGSEAGAEHGGGGGGY